MKDLGRNQIEQLLEEIRNAAGEKEIEKIFSSRVNYVWDEFRVWFEVVEFNEDTDTTKKRVRFEEKKKKKIYSVISSKSYLDSFNLWELELIHDILCVSNLLEGGSDDKRKIFKKFIWDYISYLKKSISSWKKDLLQRKEIEEESTGINFFSSTSERIFSDGFIKSEVERIKNDKETDDSFYSLINFDSKSRGSLFYETNKFLVNHHSLLKIFKSILEDKEKGINVDTFFQKNGIFSNVDFNTLKVDINENGIKKEDKVVKFFFRIFSQSFSRHNLSEKYRKKFGEFYNEKSYEENDEKPYNKRNSEDNLILKNNNIIFFTAIFSIIVLFSLIFLFWNKIKKFFNKLMK